MIDRLQRAARDVLTRPLLYWVIAALFAVQRLFFIVTTPRRFDAEGMWEGAHAYLTDPSHMYDKAADYLARLHIIAPPGGLDAFVSPPAVAALAMPVALLPRSIGAQVWTAMDAVALNREVMGATNPANAAPGTIRKDFAESIEANSVHGSDSPENAAQEIAFFFSAIEICP